MDPYRQDHSYCKATNITIPRQPPRILQNSQRVQKQLTDLSQVSQHTYSITKQITGTKQNFLHFKKQGLDGISYSLSPAKTSAQKLEEISDPLAITDTNDKQQNDMLVPVPLIETKQEQQDDVSDLLALTETIEEQDPLAITDTNDKQQNDILVPLPLIGTKEEQQDHVNSELLASSPTGGMAIHKEQPKLQVYGPSTKEQQQDHVNSELLPSSPTGGMAIHKQQPKLRVYGPSPLKLRIVKKPPNTVNPILIRPVPKRLKPVVVQQQKKPISPPLQSDKSILDTFNMSSQITSSERQIRLLNIGLYPPTPSRRIGCSIPAEERITGRKQDANHLLVWKKKVAKKGKIIKNLRKIIRDLRKQADVINGIQSPALKSLVLSVAANKKCKPSGKRWPESVKAVAYNIYKTSSSAAYKYVSEVFQLPNAKALQKYRSFHKNERPPLLTQKNTKNENALTERMLKRMDKMIESSVEDTRIPLNMRILIKGASNVGKSCLLQRLQGGPFIEEYVPSEQTQIAPIHWKHENSDYKVHAKVWDVVDKGQCDNNTPRDVYKEASGVILMMDITKPRSFEYVVKELAQIPGDLPVVVLGNQCDQQRRRQVPPRHVNQLLRRARLDRTGPVRYTESSMRNGFGLRLLHKFLSVPFLRLQRASLLEQLQRCQRDAEDLEREMDDFQNSEEADYGVFLERLASERRDERLRETAAKARLAGDQSQQASGHLPDLHEGTNRPMEPPTEVSQFFKPRQKKRKAETSRSRESKKQCLYPEMLKPRNEVVVETTPSEPVRQHSGGVVVAEGGTIDVFYPDPMDSNFLVDFTVAANQEQPYYDSDTANQDLEETCPANRVESTHSKVLPVHINSNQGLNKRLKRSLALGKIDYVKKSIYHKGVREHPASQSQPSLSMPSLDNEPLDTGAKRLPEGRKSPNVAETLKLRTKKKPKEKGVFSQKSPRAELNKLISVKKSSHIPRGGDEYVSFEQYEF